jgi:hypothetical protein
MLDLNNGKLTIWGSLDGHSKILEGNEALQVLKEGIIPLNFEGLNEIVKDFIITDPVYSDSNKQFDITPESTEFSMLYNKIRDLTEGQFEPGKYSIPKLAETLTQILEN